MASRMFLWREDYGMNIDGESIYSGTIESVNVIILLSSWKMRLGVAKMDICKKIQFYLIGIPFTLSSKCYESLLKGRIKPLSLINFKINKIAFLGGKAFQIIYSMGEG